MKKISLLLIAFLVLTLSFGCAPKEKDTKDGITKATMMLDWFPNTNHTGVYVAKDKGFYEEEGLDINIVQPPEGGTAQIIAANKAEFGFSYQEEVTSARAEDIPIKAIASVIQHNTSGFAALSKKNIKSPKDFENKSYGGWGSPAETAMIKALMKKYDADFNKVKMINIGSADFFTSVEKDVDFEWIFYGWTGVEAELRGMDIDFIKLRDEEPVLDFYTPVIIINEKMEKENPELVRKFLRATAKGYEYAINNPEDAASILVKAVPNLDKDLVINSQKYLAKEYQSDAEKWGLMDEVRWKDYATWMFEQDLIKKNIDPAKAFTNEFLPKE